MRRFRSACWRPLAPIEPLARAIRQLAGGHSLSAEDTAEAFGAIMRGEASPAQVAAILVALRVKGETIHEVAGGARALRDAMVRLPGDAPETLVDTCGTGGGAVMTFNISTAAAIIVKVMSTIQRRTAIVSAIGPRNASSSTKS